MNASAHRILCLLRKELIQLRRDKRLFGLLILAPVIQLLILGSAATTDIRLMRVGVRDRDHTPQSREFVRALGASGWFRPFALEGPEHDDPRWFEDGRAGIIVAIPPGFGRTLEQGRPATVQAIVDGSDANFGVQGMNYLNKAAREFSGRLSRDTAARMADAGVAMPAVAVESRAWYNPGLASSRFMVPAVMGVLLMVTTMLVTSMALVKEREAGTMEQLIVTPLRPREMIVGKLLPFVVVGFIEATLALPVIGFLFGIPLRGSLASFYAFSGLFLLSTLGLGLFISLLVHTQQQAMLVAAFFVLMPFVLLSGFVFPVDNMPAALQPLAHAIPLKYYLTSIRGLFLKGTGWAELWPDAVVLLGWGLGILSLAVARFHKRID